LHPIKKSCKTPENELGDLKSADRQTFWWNDFHSGKNFKFEILAAYFKKINGLKNVIKGGN